MMTTVNDVTSVARRVTIIGASGAGKSTLGAALASELGVPWIELDALHHGPNWAEPPVAVFRARVQAALDAAPGGWVVDGNYGGKLGDLVLDAADTIVWLDPPLRVMFPRLWRRTLHRIRHDVELWNGNRETWRDQFASRETIFYWAVRSHFRHRRGLPAMRAWCGCAAMRRCAAGTRARSGRRDPRKTSRRLADVVAQPSETSSATITITPSMVPMVAARSNPFACVSGMISSLTT